MCDSVYKIKEQIRVHEIPEFTLPNCPNWSLGPLESWSLGENFLS